MLKRPLKLLMSSTEILIFSRKYAPAPVSSVSVNGTSVASLVLESFLAPCFSPPFSPTADL